MTAGSAAAFAKPQSGQSGSGVVGTGGSAAAGGTSASTLGVGGQSTGPSSTSSALGTGGSAAASGGRTTSWSKVHQTGGGMMGQSKAMGKQHGGVWSKSHTKPKVGQNGKLTSRIKSISHEPGGPPTRSTSRMSEQIPQ